MRTALTLVALLLALVTAGMAIRSPMVAEPADDCRYDTSRALALPLGDVIGPDDPVFGDPDAETVLVEFFDPNCIHCRALHPALKEVVERHRDRIRYYRKPFALNRHSVSQVAAMLIAAEEKKFFEMADRQMEHPDAPYLSDDELIAIASEIGMDQEVFAEKLASGAYLNRVQLLRQQARAAGVRGTPTLVINDRRHVLAPTSHSAECIDALVVSEIES